MISWAGAGLGWPLLACLLLVALRRWVLGRLETLGGLAGGIFISGALYLSDLLLLDRLKLYTLDVVIPSSVRQWLPKRA